MLQSSVKVHVLVIIRSLGQEPIASVSVNTACKPVEQLSASLVTSPVTVIVASYPQVAFLYMVKSAGAVKVGFVLSKAVIICTFVVVFPQASVSVQVLVMIS